MAKELAQLLEERPVFINLGVRGFAESLRDAGYEVVHVNWAPPAGGDSELASILDDLI
jgi:FdrA protein